MATVQEFGNSFPLDGCRPRLAHDGECLILKGVLVGDEYLDIKIWRTDDKGKKIVGDLEKPWPVDLIVQAAKIAQQTFVSNSAGQFLGKKYWYKNTEPPSYKVENLKTDEEFPIDDQPQLADLRKNLKAAHDVFFTIRSGAVMPGSMITAKYEAPSDWNVEEEEEADLESVQGAEEDEEEDEVASPTGTPRSLEEDDEEAGVLAKRPKRKLKPDSDDGQGSSHLDPATSAQFSKAKAKEQDTEQRLRAANVWDQPLDVPDGREEWPAHLQKLTFKQLHDYANEYARKPSSCDASSPVGIAYTSFVNLLKGEEDKDMFDWLSVVYKAAVNQYVEEEDAQDTAARAIVGFIRVKSTPIETLVRKLIDEVRTDLYSDAV